MVSESGAIRAACSKAVLMGRKKQKVRWTSVEDAGFFDSELSNSENTNPQNFEKTANQQPGIQSGFHQENFNQSAGGLVVVNSQQYHHQNNSNHHTSEQNIPEQLKLSDFMDKSLLILDDDDPLRGRLARAMEKKGFEVIQAEGVQKGIDSVKAKKPGFAVVDLRLADGNGLEVVKEIQTSNSDSRIIMLTGYGNIPTAVAAIKEGAIDYLAKPADAEDVEKALLADPSKKAAPPENPMSADRVKWEHIHRVFELCNRNVSETARRLKMHRRTLQRILSKRSPK